MIGMEIQSMLRDDVDGENGPPAAVLDEAIRHLLKEQIALQTRIDEAVRGKKSAKKLEAKLAAVEEQIVQWGCDKDTCEHFVQSYVRNADKDGYLQTAVREIGRAHTTLDALARIFGFRAGIWQHTDDIAILKFVGWVNSEVHDGETVHMLHNGGGVHFDKLLVVKSPK